MQGRVRAVLVPLSFCFLSFGHLGRFCGLSALWCLVIVETATTAHEDQGEDKSDDDADEDADDDPD